jgi:hypothetical protein
MRAVKYPPRVAARLKHLRVEGWHMTTDEEQTAQPAVDLVFFREGIPLAPQKVNVIYLTTGGRPFASNRTLASGASIEAIADVRVSRLIEDGFDVQVGDRFTLFEQPGQVNQVSQAKGLIWASLGFDTGSA